MASADLSTITEILTILYSDILFPSTIVSSTPGPSWKVPDWIVLGIMQYQDLLRNIYFGNMVVLIWAILRQNVYVQTWKLVKTYFSKTRFTRQLKNLKDFAKLWDEVCFVSFNSFRPNVDLYRQRDFFFRGIAALSIFNLLSANPTKWSSTLKQFVGCCRRIVWMCLTILWGWRRLKG